MSDLFQYYTEVFRNMSREPKFDPVMIDLEKHLLKQEEDYIDPRERAQEIRERAADDACSTWEEELPNA